MAKTIKITFYSPKELWLMFWNWAFWPRRKECAKWCEYYDALLIEKVVKILQHECEFKQLSDREADILEIAIKRASEEVAEITAKMMSEPMNDN